MALTEILVIDDRLREMILQGESSSALAAAAVEAGMATLRQSGLRAIFEGQTTVEEVLRETGNV
jgi:type IV pilus assembly protein PilB